MFLSLMLVFVISVGMVSASEDNISTDVDSNILQDSVSEDVLSDPAPVDFFDIEIGANYSVSAKLKTLDDSPVSERTVDYSYDNVSGSVVTDSEGKLNVQAVKNSVLVLNFAGDDSFAPSNLSLSLGDFKPELTPAKFNIADGHVYNCYAVEYQAGERGKAFTVKLTDNNGNPIANASVQFGINGLAHNKTTDENGIAELPINFQAANSYTCAIFYAGNESTTAVFNVAKLVVKQKTVSISAAAKSYKKATKTKKYTVTLKTIKGSSANGKVYFKAGKKVTLEVGGKTYTAKTNSKGQVTFKITKLTKKGKFTAVIKYAGDSTYKAVSKKVKITIK